MRKLYSDGVGVRALALLSALSASFLFTATVSAQTPTVTVINACVSGDGDRDKADGRVVRIVAAGQLCRPGETRLTWNVVGPQGPAGPVGPQGIAGSQGPAGSKGDTGSAGAAGAQGLNGDKGNVGATGATGAKGDIGATGAQGLKGDKGDIGATGATGANGETGATGSTGAQGLKGDVGAQGSKGETGATGATGAMGVSVVTTADDGTGCLALAGLKLTLVNATGTVVAGTAPAYVCNGATGPQGPTGPIGSIGPQGLKGDGGATGATGNQGLQGLKGDTGAKGDAGGKGDIGATGGQGIQGPQGDTGPKGSVGAKGDGFQFRGAWQSAVAFTANDVVTMNGSVWVATADNLGSQPLSTPAMWSLFAAKGDGGATGLQGPGGAVGTAGADGLPGPAGPQGPQGTQGSSGATLVHANNWFLPSYQGLSDNVWVLIPGSAFTATTAGGPLEIGVDLGSIELSGGLVSCMPTVDGQWAGALAFPNPQAPNYVEGIKYNSAGQEWSGWSRSRVYSGISSGTHTFAVQCWGQVNGPQAPQIAPFSLNSLTVKELK